LQILYIYEKCCLLTAGRMVSFLLLRGRQIWNCKVKWIACSLLGQKRKKKKKKNSCISIEFIVAKCYGLVNQNKNRPADLSFIQVYITKGCGGSVVKNINFFQQIIMHVTYSYCWAYTHRGIWRVLRTVFTSDHAVSPEEICFYIKACWCSLDYSWDIHIPTPASCQSLKSGIVLGLVCDTVSCRVTFSSSTVEIDLLCASVNS